MKHWWSSWYSVFTICVTRAFLICLVLNSQGNFAWSADNLVDDSVYSYLTYTEAGLSYTGVLVDFRLYLKDYQTNIAFDHGLAITG